jgi:hypothetical protein
VNIARRALIIPKKTPGRTVWDEGSSALEGV